MPLELIIGTVAWNSYFQVMGHFFQVSKMSSVDLSMCQEICFFKICFWIRNVQVVLSLFGAAGMFHEFEDDLV